MPENGQRVAGRDDDVEAQIEFQTVKKIRIRDVALDDIGLAGQIL